MRQDLRYYNTRSHPQDDHMFSVFIDQFFSIHIFLNLFISKKMELDVTDRNIKIND
jgi:hypothetical protein